MASNTKIEETESQIKNDSKPIDRIYRIDGLFPKIDNLENFPTEALFQIFAATDDLSLMHLASIHGRYEPIAQDVFNQRYANKYFVLEGDSERHQEEYFAQLVHFGSGIIAVEANGIQHIDNNHWIVQRFFEQTPNLAKLRFNKCSFEYVDEIFLKDLKLTHLSFRGGFCEKRGHIRLPEFQNLKKLELLNFHSIWKPSLERILQNNPQMESLILKSCDNSYFHYFTLTEVMELVSNHLKNLKELNLVDCADSHYTERLDISLINKFVRVLESLESFGIILDDDVAYKLLPRMKSNCKNINHLEISCSNFKDEMIRKICAFDQVESLSIVYCSHQDQLESIIERFPNLRSVHLLMMNHRTNDEILSIVRECKDVKKLVIETGREYISSYSEEGDEINDYKLNVHFHEKFIKTIQSSHIKEDFRVEFKEWDKTIGLVTKDRIVWRDKLLHWVGYDPIHNHSNVQLLDLATVPKGSKVKHKQPLNLIFNYLDLNSLYNFCQTNKECKQLVHNYVFQRSKQQLKNRAKLRSAQRGKFFITDEFGFSSNVMRTFGKSIRNLEVIFLDFHPNFIRDEIANYCKNLTKLCVRTRAPIDPDCLIFPQLPLQHIIFYGYDYVRSGNREFRCNLCTLLHRCPVLEILEIKTVVNIYVDSSVKPNTLRNLKKILFKPYDDSQLKTIEDFFKNADTEVVIDRSL